VATLTFTRTGYLAAYRAIIEGAEREIKKIERQLARLPSAKGRAAQVV
jgi:hypothetical protein